MIVYRHAPYARIIFYLFTIAFHAFLLIRTYTEAKYLLASVLLIPVTAISAALVRYMGHAATQISLEDSTMEIRTLFRNFTYNTDKIRLNGGVIQTPDRKFRVSRSKIQGLTEQMK